MASDGESPAGQSALAIRVERGTAALIPFVQRWKLNLNPEDLAEIAWAVLEHADSTTDFDEVHVLVHEQLDEFERRARSLYSDLRDQ